MMSLIGHDLENQSTFIISCGNKSKKWSFCWAQVFAQCRKKRHGNIKSREEPLVSHILRIMYLSSRMGKKRTAREQKTKKRKFLFAGGKKISHSPFSPNYSDFCVAISRHGALVDVCGANEDCRVVDDEHLAMHVDRMSSRAVKRTCFASLNHAPARINTRIQHRLARGRWHLAFLLPPPQKKSSRRKDYWSSSFDSFFSEKKSSVNRKQHVLAYRTCEPVSVSRLPTQKKLR